MIIAIITAVCWWQSHSRQSAKHSRYFSILSDRTICHGIYGLAGKQCLRMFLRGGTRRDLAVTSPVSWSLVFHFALIIVVKFCDQSVCLSVCLCVCLFVWLSVCSHVSETLSKFHEILCTWYLSRWCLVLLWWQCKMLHISGFVDDIMFPHNRANRPESEITHMFHPVRQVEAPVTRHITLFDRVSQIVALGAKSAILNTWCGWCKDVE